MKANLNGLRAQLRKFDENGYYVSGKSWRIARGGYDCYFEISYNNTAVLQCVCNKLYPCADCDNYRDIERVVMEEYPECKSSLPTFYVYAGYYELYITTKEMYSPYVYQKEFDNIEDAIDYCVDRDDTIVYCKSVKDHLPNYLYETLQEEGYEFA